MKNQSFYFQLDCELLSINQRIHKVKAIMAAQDPVLCLPPVFNFRTSYLRKLERKRKEIIRRQNELADSIPIRMVMDHINADPCI